MTEEIVSPVEEQPSGNWLTPNPEPPVEPPPSVTPPPTPFSLYALFALIAGLLAPILALGLSIILAFSLRNSDQSTPLLISTVMAVGLLGLPLAWYAFWRLRGKSRPWRSGILWIVLGVAVAILLLIIGQALASFKVFPEITLGIIQPLIFLAASAGLIGLIAGKWMGISKLRAWASLASGAWLAVGLALVAEIVLVVVLAGVGFVILTIVAPDDAARIMVLVRNPNNVNPEAFLEFAFRPWLIGGAFLLAAVLIPLLEELFKPLSVILILGKRPTAMAAFIGGVLGGLGFAFSESLSNLMNISDPWFVLVVARLGTLVMHGFTAGLVGWGWGQLAAKRPLNLFLAYIGAVSIHGLWNGLVVVMVFSGLYVSENPDPVSFTTGLLGLLAGVGALIVILLVPACIAGAIAAGYYLRRRE